MATGYFPDDRLDLTESDDENVELEEEGGW